MVSGIEENNYGNNRICNQLQLKNFGESSLTKRFLLIKQFFLNFCLHLENVNIHKTKNKKAEF